MKKLLLLFAVLLGTVGAWAQLVKTSTAEAPIYYVMASYNRGGVITYGEVDSAVEHKACTKDGKSEWYFEAVPDNNDNGVYIVSKYKDGENKVYLDKDRKASYTPAVWYVLENGVNNYGYCIASGTATGNSNCLDASNNNSSIGGWAPSASDWHGTTWVFFEVENKVYNPNNYVAQQGTADRAITSITINSVTQSFSTYGLAYADHTSRVEFKVAAGGEVAISIGRTGNWMHSYAYVDEDADGFTIQDAVTYSYLSSTGANSAGVANGDNTVVMPNFTAPVTAGEYRLRVKYDRDDLDPNGGAQFATAGSQFVDVTLIVVNNPLTPIIPLAEALYNSTKDNTGTAIGEYPAEKVEALATAIEKAKAIPDDDATDDDVLALQTAMDAVKANLPTAGQYYQIHSSLAAFSEVKAVYSNGSQLAWKSLNADDKSFYWKAVATPDGGVVFQNAADNKYMVGSAAQSGAWTVADEYTDASKASFKIFSKAENEKGYEYGVVLSNWQMHCAGHSNGAGTSGNIVSWNTDNANSASSWYIVETELPTFYSVTYNFVYDEEVKYSTTVSIAANAGYPEVTIPVLPYGVITTATKPEGTVTEDKEFNFALTLEHELPFKTAADVASIDTWYYAQMHANPAVTAYIQDDKNANNNVDWNDKSVDATEIDSHLWGFAGDVWTGIKMVNKGTGRAIVSTSGSAVMGDKANATAFIPTYSNGAYNAYGWFCMKYPSSNYLNASGDQSKGEGKVNSYGNADNGSSFLLTEYKETEVSVSAADYATLYLGQATYIPEDVEVYSVTAAANGYATLTAVEGVLPANTGVILKNAGTYTFKTAGATGSAEGNLLRGSVEDAYVAGPAYVLANGTNGVGLYKATLNKDAEGADGTTHFLNKANKAYLPAATGAESRFLVFNFGDDNATAIEGIEAESTANAVVYDLAGRRVQKAQKGLYIVNGKKVIK
ncbi:MAG: hypothetical protein UH687_06665 [Bacteroidaceae bacterium]|nr:hypothetical protein [Bacteroidaceae bacterium]